ncbi:hypothetical protein L6164_016438 [Bauhinia variegata]|uniref:Uncharacterized protein n=1 Tax=Bauhinia variegata TaxID=167791 RepID=A0ACB9NT08_BAUVA|nr:hypothetical protein L6164_016438 [Bauhinia variegata]
MATLPPTHYLASPANSKPFSTSRNSCSTKYRRWDSNAETVRSRKFNFNFKGKGENDDEEEEKVDEFGKKRQWWSDESPGMEEETSGIWEEAVDNLWIFEIFRSYGWTLPIIILSWLLASGPKAFLMALVLPLGQSALQLAFEMLWGKAESKPKRKSRMRRKPPTRTATGTKRKEEEETQNARGAKAGYQSWVDENYSSVNRGSRDERSFGGWEDLDRSGPATSSSGMRGAAQRTPTEMGKLSRRERKRDRPLLLRLLIALFPFLGSWTKML